LTMGGRIFHQTHWSPLLRIQGSVAEVKLDVVHREGHTIPMIFNALRRERAGVTFHELAAFVAEDRNKYERELVQARKRAEELLLKEQQAQEALSLAQGRLRLALDSAQLYVWDLEPNTRVPRYEPKVALLLGDPTPRPVTHAEFLEHVHPEDRAEMAAERHLDAFAAESGYDATYRLRRRDGAERTVRATGRGFFDASGVLQQVVGLLRDVTVEVRQRAAAEDRALFAEQMIGIVSHDLRNPLAVVQMGAVLLGRSQVTPSQARTIDRIAAATGRANRLITDLLDFTQARVGTGLKVQRGDVDLHTLVGASVDELSLAFPGRHLLHHPHGQGTTAVDADRLVQMLGNLVANAVSYGAPDRPVVVTTRVAAGGASVSVHNDGAPIPPDLLPIIFEPMTRGQGTSSRRSVGLGLFIVREILRAHGGAVAVESSASAGTTFTARFPGRATAADMG